jgi:hypothetical protein
LLHIILLLYCQLQIFSLSPLFIVTSDTMHCGISFETKQLVSPVGYLLLYLCMCVACCCGYFFYGITRRIAHTGMYAWCEFIHLFCCTLPSCGITYVPQIPCLFLFFLMHRTGTIKTNSSNRT